MHKRQASEVLQTDRPEKRGRFVNVVTYGDFSPAMVFGNFFAGGTTRQRKPMKPVRISPAPVTVVEVIDVEETAVQKKQGLPVVSDVD
jgi:hypothetical protein